MADITKSVAPAGRITSKCHPIVLDDADSYAQHKATRSNIKLHKKGNACVMRVKITPPGDEGLPPDKDDAHVLV